VFEKILGNEPLKTYFQKAISEDKFPHALLFKGADGIGKSLFAKEIARHFLQTTAQRIAQETHPDLHLFRPDGKSGLHSIESIRSLITQVHASPFEAQAKVFIIYEADRMQPVAANALLKTLEEPTPNTYLILLSSLPEDILPTLKSRCSILFFNSLSPDQIGSLLKQKNLPEHFALLAQGSMARALELAEREPIEASLFPYLAEKRPYFELSSTLDKIEKALENEDPVKQNKNIEYLFSSIFMWYRDQHLRRFQGRAKLFFPQAPSSSFQPPSLEKMGALIDEARLSYQRNIKLSVCLEKIIYY
jgi:DNA polymerase-3 subunit delta'